MRAIEATPRPPGPETAPYWTATCDPRPCASGLDLSVLRGPGPGWETDGALRVLFDGRLHDRRALGGQDRGQSDARLILEAYQRLGQRLVGRVRGRFALLIWDGGRGELLCLRDQVGAYPLFWARAGGTIALSTGIAELVALPAVPDTLNRAVLAEHLCGRWPSIEDTHYAAVSRLPPGHAMHVTSGRRRLYRYWDPVPRAGSPDWLSEPELGRFDAVFERAVARCLEPGPAAILLSGGLDSVSVAAAASDLCTARGMPAPTALSLAFPHRDTDEREAQRSVAQALGLPQLLLSYDEAVAPHGRVGATVRASESMPVPLIALWAPAYWPLAERARERGCRVLLTGGGGDEILVASQLVAGDLLRRGDARGLWRLYRDIRRSYPWGARDTLKQAFWTYGARPLVVRAARDAAGALDQQRLRERWRRQVRAGTPPWVLPEPALARTLEARALGMIAAWPPPLGANYYEHECRAALDGVIAAMELERRFEEGRRLGVQIMEPFWDVDLQELLLRVPPELLNRDGHTKGLVRARVARRLPGLGLASRPKVIGDALANEIFVSEVPGALREIGGAQALAELGIVDAREVERAVTRMASDPRARADGHRLWHLLNLEAWVRPRLGAGEPADVGAQG
ncbi:MAG: asparagine synthetase B family protein [Egibacteraceae bacterium]